MPKPEPPPTLPLDSYDAPLYSVGTWDIDQQAYTPQCGLTMPCINVPLATMRQVLRELRGMGYSCHRLRGSDGSHEFNDWSVLVERTDGRPFDGQR